MAGLDAPATQGAVVRDALREQVDASLPGLVSQDVTSLRRNRDTVTIDNKWLAHAGADAAHDWDGHMLVRGDVLSRAKVAMRLAEAGRDVPENIRDAVRILVHEELHGYSLCTARSYSGIGRVLEEVGTELNARRVTGDVFGTAHTFGAYSELIDQVRYSILPVLEAEAGQRMTFPVIDKLIADAHLRAACLGGAPFLQPDDALKAFVENLEVSEKARGAILERLKAI